MIIKALLILLVLITAYQRVPTRFIEYTPVHQLEDMAAH